MENILAILLAGGAGERLFPLTKDTAKPAVPFGGTYRIIDFTLSNCINSDLRRIVILTQYKSLDLIRHVRDGWSILSAELGEYIEVIPPMKRVSDDWYQGTADAVFQNFQTIEVEAPEQVLILSGDHIYKMDYREMIDRHRRHGADITIATITFMLLRVSGVTLLEKGLGESKPGYKEYVERTSAFVPWPPRRAAKE
jgi:glucose-1-phosphate adenylyltransferase